ncbi:MAG: hypothetical protein OXI05_05355, partial [Bacteroidota bacterium]|nr:hypothetical protein [Bacteroidota bacterium]
ASYLTFKFSKKGFFGQILNTYVLTRRKWLPRAETHQDMELLFVWGFQIPVLFTCLTASMGMATLIFVTGCNDSAVTEIEVDNLNEQLERISPSTNSENRIRNKFEAKGQRFIEKISGIPWTELSQMEPSELFKLPYDIELSSVDEQTLEEWEELQELAEKLAQSNDLT